MGKQITLIWIPSHQNIRGKEQADLLTKYATTIPIQEETHKLTLAYAKNLVKQMVTQHKIKPPRSLQTDEFPIPETILSHRIWKTLNRREQAVLTRLGIGHTKFSLKHLIEKTDPPYCNQCNAPISVKHIITKCA